LELSCALLLPGKRNSEIAAATIGLNFCVIMEILNELQI
jgi:hypothetical protein